MTQLTSPSYWDQQWEGLPLPSLVDLGNVANRRLDTIFRRYLEPSSEKSFVELGCAPGQWLIYFHEEFGYRVVGYDSSELGIELCRRNLEVRGTPAVIRKEDIFSLSETERFDIVFSAGLVEHFENPREVLSIHYRLLKPGGTLIVMIPNLRHVNYVLQALVNRPVIEHHNLLLMDRARFKGLFEAESSLSLHYCQYVGVFNLGLINTKRPSHLLTWADRIVNGILRLAPPVETWFASPYLLGIARKNEP